MRVEEGAGDGKRLDWLTIQGNREAVLALLSMVTALLGGRWFLFDRLFVRRRAEGAVQSLSVGSDGAPCSR
jgi:hypothetical protein